MCVNFLTWSLIFSLSYFYFRKKSKFYSLVLVLNIYIYIYGCMRENSRVDILTYRVSYTSLKFSRLLFFLLPRRCEKEKGLYARLSRAILRRKIFFFRPKFATISSFVQSLFYLARVFSSPKNTWKKKSLVHSFFGYISRKKKEKKITYAKKKQKVLSQTLTDVLSFGSYTFLFLRMLILLRLSFAAIPTR